MKILFVFVFLIILSVPQTVYAHGFGERYDLPVPLWLYIWGSVFVVAASFVGLAGFVRHIPQTSNTMRINFVENWLGSTVRHPVSGFVVGSLGVIVLGVVVTAGLFGNQNPNYNIGPTMIWVIWWVGFSYFAALVGNVWPMLNPWNTIYRWAECLYIVARPKKRLSLNISYPVNWGVWPAVILFFTFAWFELAYSAPASPSKIAIAVLCYSLISWIGMTIFGRTVWLHHGEVFSVIFRVFAKFAPTHVVVTDTKICDGCPSDCKAADGVCVECHECFGKAERNLRGIKLRHYGSGLLMANGVTKSMVVFVILLLSTVTFDGFLATPAWGWIYRTLFGNVEDPMFVVTLGLILCPLILMLAYLSIIRIIYKMVGHEGRNLAYEFVFSLVPIALAYHLAHYISFFIVQGQRIIPLLSDPFGIGWDLLNTSDFQINISVIDARFAWIVAVSVIVIGHIFAVFISHILALRIYGQRRKAVTSQYPMVLLMLTYTILSLWIIAQPIVER